MVSKRNGRRDGSRRREALSHFLRMRRAGVAPGDVGLRAVGQRRTPGLRREEVAVLAGVGTSWYTWLEQGREINVSEPVAYAIGSALKLNDDEFRYFYGLLEISPQFLRARHPHKGGTRDLPHLVDSLMPHPALIADYIWNIRVANASARLVFGLAEADKNLLVSLFTNKIIRSRCADFSRVARYTVAQFRASIVGHYGDPVLERMISDLSRQSSDFASLWHSHDVLVRPDGNRKEVDHPTAGRLVFETHSWTLDGTGSVRLFLHLPARVTDTPRRVADLLRASLDLSHP
jgi:MmyB-like transcription regulator ligand binding domain/Helix-turn-helix domain